MFAGEPEHVGVEEEKEDEADGEEVHVETEKDADVEEIPAGVADTPEGVGAADDCDDCWNNEERGGAVIGEAGEEIRYTEADEDKGAPSQYGRSMRIEDAGSHAWSIHLRIGQAGIVWPVSG
jgi:hypothetical protein